MSASTKRKQLIFAVMVGAAALSFQGCDSSPRKQATSFVHPSSSVDTPEDAIFDPSDSGKGSTIIPLADIWAYRMPGTHEITDAVRRDGTYAHPGGELVSRILRELKFLTSNQRAGSAFAVRGHGIEALQNAEVMFSEHKDRESSKRFSFGTPISIVFFSHLGGAFIVLKEVKTIGNVIEVCYEVVPHIDTEITAHFALIPLGELPEGDYEVTVLRATTESQLFDTNQVDNSVWDRWVAGSFEFSIGRE